MAEFGNFAWLFESGLDAVFTNLIASAERMESIAEIARALLPAAGFFGLCMLIYKSYQRGPLRAMIGFVLIFGIVSAGLGKTTMQLPDRASLEVTYGQKAILQAVVPIYVLFASVFR